ncbi:MAG: hypothetical protein ACRC3B_09245 [Bacteroidia bacterium]
MKTIFAFLLILTCTQAVAQKPVQIKNTSSRIKARFGKDNSSALFAQRNERHIFDFQKLEGKQYNDCRISALGFQKKEKSGVAKTLGRVYLKNGSAGLSGGWVNNVQLTFGWRYQPLRVLTSEQPVPVHPLTMRVRVRI